MRLLLGHPQAEIVWYGSRSYIDQKYSDIYRNMFKFVDMTCKDDNMEALAKEADVIFTATPQGLCASLVNDRILEQAKIIDLSADFRIKDVSVYEKMVRHQTCGRPGISRRQCTAFVKLTEKILKAQELLPIRAAIQHVRF